jgi:uncharacterized coiled-coil protein SlyX
MGLASMTSQTWASRKVGTIKIMTNTDGIIKSLETLIKHEKTIQAQEACIVELRDILAKALHTITMHEHKLNLLCGVSTTLAVELTAVKNKQVSFGVN